MNRSQLGARHLNQLLQEALNPEEDKPEIERYGWTFRLGDRVIQTENNYDRDVFNGDLGIIDQDQPRRSGTDRRLRRHAVVYDFSDLDELALAYVLTIHKSQGSEYPCVVIPLHTQHLHDAAAQSALHGRDPRQTTRHHRRFQPRTADGRQQKGNAGAVYAVEGEREFEWRGESRGGVFSVQCSVFSVQCSVFSVRCSVSGLWSFGVCASN